MDLWIVQRSLPFKEGTGSSCCEGASLSKVFHHYALDGSCPACARDFHHRPRLICHWRTAVRCFEQVRACFPPLPNSMVEDLVKEDAHHAAEMKAKGWLATRALCPVFRGLGPILPPASSAAAGEMLAKWRTRRPPDQDPLLEQLEGHREGENDAQATIPSDESKDEIIPFIIESGAGEITGEADLYAMTGLARLHAALHVRTFCFMHFFSGYRRVGDLQHQIEAHWAQNTRLFFICLWTFAFKGKG